MKPIAAFLRFTKRFMAHEQGSVLLLFGLMVLFLVGIGGAAIDLGRQQLLTLKIQNAADAAAVSAAAITDNGQAVTDEAQKVVGRRYFNLNYPINSASDPRPIVNVERVSDNIVISTNDGDPATVTQTNFVSNLGVKTLNSQGRSATKANASATSDYDIVMLVDETGSTACPISGTCTQYNRNNERINAMKSALREMANSIVPISNSNKNVRMGFIGYSSHITLKYGLSNRNADAITAINNLRPTCNNYDHVGLMAARRMILGGSGGVSQGQIDMYRAPIAPYIGWANCGVSQNIDAPRPQTSRADDAVTDANGLSMVKNVVMLTDGDIMTEPPGCNDYYDHLTNVNCYTNPNGRRYDLFLSECNALKNISGTHVYVVNFASPPASALSTMQNCASRNPVTGQPDFYDAANTQALIEILTNITTSVKSVRIVQ